MTTTQLQPHPLAKLLPDMTPAEFQQLLEDIRTEGQRDEIVLLDDMILDGRNRYAACVNLGIAPITRTFDPDVDGDSPAHFVMSRNLIRRHLTVGQRAASAAEFKPFFQAEAEARKKATQFRPAAPPPGEIPAPTAPADTTPSEAVPSFLPPAPPDEAGTATEKAAQLMGVSPTSVKTAEQIKTQDPETFQALKAGETTLNAAAKKAARKKAQPAPDAEPVGIEERRANEAKVRETLGEEFAKAFMIGTVLAKKKDLEDFLTLDPQEWKPLETFLIEKWGVKQTLDWLSGKPGEDDKVSSLFRRLNASGKKKLSFDFPGFTVTVAKA